MKKLFALALSTLFLALTFAQEKVYLWPKKTGPGSQDLKIEQTVAERGGGNVYDRAILGVTQPYFEVHKPTTVNQFNKTGILIIPGGAYQRVVYDKEGLDYAKGYNEAGFTCFILVYRTPNDNHKDKETVPLADAQRAIRLIKERAEEFGVDSDKIGVMGSSAGGHLAATLSTRWADEVYKMQDKADKQKDGSWTDARPAFQLLMYPVITMQEKIAHEGSRKALLGTTPDQNMQDFFSCEKLVTDKTPIAWLCAAVNDKSVNPENNLIPYWTALKKANVQSELHIFPASGHGFGIRGASGTARQWQNLSIEWLKTYVK